MAITRAGVLLDELLPAYYDSVRDVTVRDKANETRVVRINDPATPDEQTGQPLMIGDEPHDVTLSTGPAQDSEREAASDFADSLLATPFANVVADLAVKLKNVGPIGDEIADRLHALLPPQVQQAEDAKKADPAQMMQQLQQAQQMIQMLTKELNAKTQLVETDEIKAKQQIEVEKVKQAGQREQQAMEFEIEKLRVVADLLKTRATLEIKQTEAEIDQAIAELDGQVALAGSREARQDAASEADKDRSFQSTEAERGRQAEAALAESSAEARPSA